MRNKALLFIVIFFCLCIQVFSQIDSGDQEESTTIDNFIDDFIDGFWYRRYLPIENLGEYHEYSAFLSEMKENDQEDRGIRESAESIKSLYKIVMNILVDEDRRVTQILDTLTKRFKSDEEVIAAASMYESFSAAISENTFPVDKDSFVECVRIIDELYSRLITRAEYVLLNERHDIPAYDSPAASPQSALLDTYNVAEGDYLKKIAAQVYGNESLWKHIYNANIDNRSFLPDPNNADLILPGVSIKIPLLPSNSP